MDYEHLSRGCGWTFSCSRLVRILLVLRRTNAKNNHAFRFVDCMSCGHCFGSGGLQARRKFSCQTHKIRDFSHKISPGSTENNLGDCFDEFTGTKSKFPSTPEVPILPVLRDVARSGASR